MRVDEDGQPSQLGFNSHRRLERDISELLGLAKGILADGVVSDAEAVLLSEWLTAHPEPVAHWPCDRIAARLNSILADGSIDADERTDLTELLHQLVGGDAGILDSEIASTSLPFTAPPPHVIFAGRDYVLTGKFASGPRVHCERLVVERGGRCGSTVTRRTDYLVVGTFGSRDWVHSAYGRKIEKAVEYRAGGVPLAIISERHWANAIS